MGLLSDPDNGSTKWVRALGRYHRGVCWASYVAALGWFLALGSRQLSNETYFSENALLPGLVTGEFNAEPLAKQLLRELQQELEDKYSERSDMPVPWLVGKMSQMHLEVYTHNFTLNYPMGHGQVYKGTNVYGILRAARSPSLEALVLSAPFRPLASHQKGTAAGIALMLAFAHFATPQKYWAKDIIFLITEHEQLGMQAWLEAYHGIDNEPQSYQASLGPFGQAEGPQWGPWGLSLAWLQDRKCLDAGKLKGRSGSIQAAINLEFHTPNIKYVEVKVEGLNGQLPNLDLVNLLHKLCVKAGVHHSYQHSYSWVRARDEWWGGARSLLAMALEQLDGVPNGNHGLFHRFGIEAATLEGRDANDPAGPAPRAAALTPATFRRLGAALESAVRSLNNLLERFHQSYFFYLLAATNRFISIGQYMPSLCLMCVAMLIRALSIWVHDVSPRTDDKDDDEGKPKSSSSDVTVPGEQKPKEAVTEEAKSESDEEGKAREDDDDAISIAGVGANYLLVHLVGYAVLHSPRVFAHVGARYFELHSEVSVFYGLIASSVLSALLAPSAARWAGLGAGRALALSHVLALLELATVCLCVGMHNYPLGLCLAAVYTPLALTVGAPRNRARGWVSRGGVRALCLLAHPLAALLLGMALYSRALFPDEPLLQAASRGADAAMQGIMFAVVDSMIYGNWVFSVVSSLMLPLWLLAWQLASAATRPARPARS